MYLTVKLRFRRGLLGIDGGESESTNLFGRAHGLERARDDLRRPDAIPVVDGFRFEQLRVRENDPELVVQAVEERPEFGRFVHRSPRLELLDAQRARRHQAWFRPSACHID